MIITFVSSCRSHNICNAICKQGLFSPDGSLGLLGNKSNLSPAFFQKNERIAEWMIPDSEDSVPFVFFTCGSEGPSSRGSEDRLKHWC